MLDSCVASGPVHSLASLAQHFVSPCSNHVQLLFAPLYYAYAPNKCDTGFETFLDAFYFSVITMVRATLDAWASQHCT